MVELIDTLCPACGSPEIFEKVGKGCDFEYATLSEEFEFVRCGNCSVLYLNPRPSIELLDVIYPSNYEPYHFDKEITFVLKIRNALEKRKARFLAALLPRNAKVLDAGCGGSTFLKSLNEHNPGSWKLFGNDISETALTKVSEAGFIPIDGRFEDIDAKSTSFDAIVLMQVIEHLDKPQRIVEKAFELLKPDGLLIIETPNFESWDARIFMERYWGGYHFPRHWTIFSVDSLCMMAEKVGFVTYQREFMLSPVFWSQSIHHWASEKPFFRKLSKRISPLNPICLALGSVIDVIQKYSVGTTSNMRLVFRKVNY